MKTTSFTIVMIVALSALPAFGQQATREDFNELMKVMAGRWVGEVTFIADWPGVGKKGQKVTGYSEIKIAEDGNALSGRNFGGTGSGTWLIVFDAAAKQIKEAGVDSGGTVWTASYFKEGGKWRYHQTGSLGDGSKIEGKYAIAISDNGNTHTWTGPTTIGGKSADALHDVFRRVSK